MTNIFSDQSVARVENMTLAPAAGSGVGKLLADLLLADSDFLPAMKDAAMGALRARTAPRWDKDAREWADSVDSKTRLAAFLGILAQMEGEPIKRIVHQHLNGGNVAGDLVSELRDNPTLLAAAERAIEKAKFRGRNVTPPVEGEASEVTP